MLSSYDGAFLPPGQLPTVESLEQDLTSVIWQPLHRCVVGANKRIAGTSRDDGHTNFTDVLRFGLLLTKNSAGNFTHWGGAVSLDADLIQGVLLISMKMQRNGINTDRWMGHIMLGGYVKAMGLIVPGTSASGIVGHAREVQIRRQMRDAFTFDDDPLKHVGRPLSADEATLNDLSNVVLTSPTNGQVLKYVSADEEWVNAADAIA